MELEFGSFLCSPSTFAYHPVSPQPTAGWLRLLSKREPITAPLLKLVILSASLPLFLSSLCFHKTILFFFSSPASLASSQAPWRSFFSYSPPKCLYVSVPSSTCFSSHFISLWSIHILLLLKLPLMKLKPLSLSQQFLLLSYKPIDHCQTSWSGCTTGTSPPHVSNEMHQHSFMLAFSCLSLSLNDSTIHIVAHFQIWILSLIP